MSDQPVIVPIDLPGRSHSVEIGFGLLNSVGDRLTRLGCGARATVISDSTVASLFGDRIGQSLLRAGIEYAMLAVSPGDSSKSLEIAAQLYGELAQLKHDRSQPIIALGGGVAGDLAGFVASTWHRGVPFVQCPTSLEAMIDASIGGKTALNIPAGKNLIGTFHQPALVCIDPDCLATLSDRDFRAGLAESVKHSVIDSPDFLEWQLSRVPEILSRQPAALLELIRRNCQIKAKVIVADERETAAAGVGRAALNFGHSVGHAIEAAAGYSLRHGEAVSIGMVAEAELAVRCCGFSDSERNQLVQLLTSFGLPSRTTVPSHEVRSRISLDKKNREEKVRFALPREFGRLAWLESPPLDDLLAAISHVCPA